MLHGAFAEGLEAFDFLGDRDAWKLDWTREVEGHAWLFVFADTLRGRLLHLAKFRVAPRLRRARRALASLAARRRSAPR